MVSSDDIAHKKKSRWNTLRVSVGYRRWRGAPDHPRGTGGAFHCAGVCESHRSGKWWSFAGPLVLQRGEGECARVVTTHSPPRGRATLGDGLVQPTLYQQVGSVNTESIRVGEPLHDRQGPGQRSESGSGSGVPSGSSHRPTSSANQDV